MARIHACILSRGYYFEEDRNKLKMLVTIVNKIFQSLFSFENCDGVEDLDFMRRFRLYAKI